MEPTSGQVWRVQVQDGGQYRQIFKFINFTIFNV